MYKPNLSLEDIEGLRTFRNYLTACVHNLKQIGELQHVQSHEVLHTITDRLTGQLSTIEMDHWEERNGEIKGEAEWLLGFIVRVVRRTTTTCSSF